MVFAPFVSNLIVIHVWFLPISCQVIMSLFHMVFMTILYETVLVDTDVLLLCILSCKLLCLQLYICMPIMHIIMVIMFMPLYANVCRLLYAYDYALLV